MIRAALVGAGNIARAHLAALRGLEGVECVAVCDRSPVMAESTAEAFAVRRWFTDFALMLSEARPDVVHVTTPPAAHESLACLALAAGAHVFVEKPITTRQGALESMIELAAAHGRHVVEDQNYLFNGTFVALEEALAAGRLGELLHVDVLLALGLFGAGSRAAEPATTNPFAALRGGAVADFVTHLCSIAVRLTGPHRRARALWSKREAGTPLSSDTLLAVVEGERATAKLQFSAHAQPDTFEVVAHGTRGRIRIGLFEPRFVAELLRGGPRPLLPVRNGLAAATSELRAARLGLTRKLAGRSVALEGLGRLLRRFYEALHAGAPPPLLPDHLLAVHRLEDELLAQESPR